MHESGVPAPFVAAIMAPILARKLEDSHACTRAMTSLAGFVGGCLSDDALEELRSAVEKWLVFYDQLDEPQAELYLDLYRKVHSMILLARDCEE